jgi:hypothetical protein
MKNLFKGILLVVEVVLITAIIFLATMARAGDSVGLYNPGTSLFYLKGGELLDCAHNNPFVFGSPGDNVPLVDDWDGDGIDTVGIFKDLTQFQLRDSNDSGNADYQFNFFATGFDQAISGDWDGDGEAGIGIYNQSTGEFILKNELSQGNADLVFIYGPAGFGWVAISGDWDGDGIDTIGLYGPATSTFYLRDSNSNGPADYTFAFGPASGWIAISGDWNDSGHDSVGLYAPVSRKFYLKNTLSSGAADQIIEFGIYDGQWVPVSGRW